MKRESGMIHGIMDFSLFTFNFSLRNEDTCFKLRK